MTPECLIQQLRYDLRHVAAGEGAMGHWHCIIHHKPQKCKHPPLSLSLTPDHFRFDIHQILQTVHSQSDNNSGDSFLILILRLSYSEFMLKSTAHSHRVHVIRQLVTILY